VSACNIAPEAANNSWTWASNDPALPSHYAEHATCPYRIGGAGGNADEEGGLSTTDALGLSSGASPGTSAGWTFAAPAGTSITGLTYERYIGHSLDPDNFWSPALRADGAILSGETCLDSVGNGETCAVGGPPGEGGGTSSHHGSLRARTLTRRRLPSTRRRGMHHRSNSTRCMGGDVRRDSHALPIRRRQL